MLEVGSTDDKPASENDVVVDGIGDAVLAPAADYYSKPVADVH